MLKQIGIRLEEEMITKTKQYGLDNKLSLQAVVTQALEMLFNPPQNTPQPQLSSNMITNENDNKLSVKTANEDVRLFLQMASDALNDHETQKVIIYNNPLNIEIDQAPPIASPTTPRIFNEEIPEYYQNTVTRLDVDPLKSMPDEVWQAKVEELKRERGII